MLVEMGEVVDLDHTLFEISDLPSSLSADRKSVESEWECHQDNDV